MLRKGGLIPESRVQSPPPGLFLNLEILIFWNPNLWELSDEAYKDFELKPPSIIQDRLMETVLEEGEDILALDKIYSVKILSTINVLISYSGPVDIMLLKKIL